MKGHGNLFLLFFFLPLTGLSQNDRDSIGRTIIEEQAPDVVVEDDSYDDYDDDGNRQYFTYWWEVEDSFIVQQRKIPGDHIKKMQEDDDFWYANSEIKKKDEKNGAGYKPLGQQKWFQTLLWIVIVGGFAAFIALYLSGSNVGLFRRRTETVASESETDEIPQDIFAINYQKEIDKAAATGNYRLAIRLMFLRLLKQMTERNIIQYKHDKTNFDYLMQLQPTSYYNSFFRVTRNYEYSWYGKFPVSEETYKTIRNDFAQFDRQFR
ncbi:MAG: hypothetical protein HOP10_10645 [Chitinophagaceae bacterium]|nr:hypothetical protein [Chitinophagaceae bacterium]